MKHQCLKGMRTSFYDLESLMMDMVANISTENVKILNQVKSIFFRKKKMKK